MPEGDTIFRAARRMHMALAGRRVTRFDAMLAQLTRVDVDAPLAGRTVEKVDAVGKHLLIHFSGDLVLRTHLRMNGSWHLYRPGEEWRRRRADMRIVIETDAFVAVGFTIPVAEFLTHDQLSHHREVTALGPDLLGVEFDAQEALARLRGRGTMAIADALLAQQVMCGIGNVYKSEILFIRGIDPFRPVASVDEGELREMIAVARQALKQNVAPDDRQAMHGGGRWTTGRLNPRERLFVYGRSGERCFRCGTAILSKKQGPDARITFWCPNCQT